MIRNFIIIAITFGGTLLPFGVSASINGLSTVYFGSMRAAQHDLANHGLLADHRSPVCTTPAAQSGVITMTFVFGYMDVSSNPDSRDSGKSLYSVGSVLDTDAMSAFELILLTPCSNTGPRGIRACGFEKSRQGLTKTIKNRATGKRIKVLVRLAYSSATSNDAMNRGQYSNQQSKMTEHARAVFADGLANSDVVAYMGHARSGGGPDFAPPYLLANGHVDYSAHIREGRGISLTLAHLSRRSKPGVVALLACKSTQLFGKRVKSAARQATYITANQLFDYNRILPSAVGVMEISLGQQCGPDAQRVLERVAGQGTLSVF